MVRFDAETLILDILTSREGVLSRAGHDLRLRAERLDAWVDDAGVHLRVAADQVRPICARKGDRDAFGVLGDADLRRIASNVQGEVLQARRWPQIAFDCPLPAPDATWAQGQLTLRGVTRPLRVYLEQRNGQLHGHATVVQTAFGVEPYSTMMGAIRVADEVEIQVRAPIGLRGGAA